VAVGVGGAAEAAGMVADAGGGVKAAAAVAAVGVAAACEAPHAKSEQRFFSSGFLRTCPRYTRPIKLNSQ